MILLDTNILVRLNDVDSDKREACFDVIHQVRSSASNVCVCAQNLIEYASVATRPILSNGMARDHATVLRDIDYFLSAFLLLPEPPDIYIWWRNLIESVPSTGRKIHDARLVAFMLAHGIRELLTLDPEDFARYSMIQTRVP
jgi:predicted nucleic acid-binding protein